jgi:hypothetical protein
VNAAVRAGAITYATAVAFQLVGDLGVDANGSAVPGWQPGDLNMVFAHALVGGATNAAEGGSFKDGFLSARFAEAAAPYVSGTPLARTVESAVVSGTASALGGGNFANGAVAAAFAYLFNESGHAPKISGRGLIGDNLPDWLTGDSSKPFEGDVCMSAICVISGRPVKVIDWLPRNPLYTEMPSNCKCTEIREPQLYDPTGANNPFRK